MQEGQNIFLDYGGLIVDYQFNAQTLARAHNLALKHINTRVRNPTNYQVLKMAHEMTIGEYLDERKEGTEWTISQIMLRMLNLCGLREYASTMTRNLADIYEQNDHEVTAMPTTLESIPKLQKVGRLGIISNLPHNSIKSELGRLGLRDVFDPVVISYQVGYRKPHPAIYQEALRRAEIVPNQGIFFSHEQEEVDGALAVGMQAHLTKNLAEVLTKLTTS